jgi:hypothetical protein
MQSLTKILLQEKYSESLLALRFTLTEKTGKRYSIQYYKKKSLKDILSIFSFRNNLINVLKG